LCFFLLFLVLVVLVVCVCVCVFCCVFWVFMQTQTQTTSSSDGYRSTGSTPSSPDNRVMGIGGFLNIPKFTGMLAPPPGVRGRHHGHGGGGSGISSFGSASNHAFNVPEGFWSMHSPISGIDKMQSEDKLISVPSTRPRLAPLTPNGTTTTTAMTGMSCGCLSSPVNSVSPVSGSISSQSGMQQPTFSPSQIDPTAVVGDYSLFRLVGEGQFGSVFQAIHNITGATVAVKMIAKKKLTPETLRMVENEVAIMKLLWHPSVIHFYERLETPEHICLAMEYASHGSLMDLVSRNKRLPEDVARKYFRQVVRAVGYIHSRHVVHRDIKAENLLLDERMNIKLVDFGLSCTFTPGEHLKTFCGSPTYASPELVQRKSYVGPEVDCWSLGVLLYYMLVGSLPFTGTTFVDLYRKIIAARFRMPPFISASCAELIHSILTPNAHMRATINDMLNHPWFNQGHHHHHCHHHHRHHHHQPHNSPERSVVLSEDLAGVPSPSGPGLDVSALSRMESLGYHKSEVVQAVMSHKFDSTTAVYFIVCDQAEKNTDLTPPIIPPEFIGAFSGDDHTDESDDSSKPGGTSGNTTTTTTTTTTAGVSGTRKNPHHHRNRRHPPAVVTAQQLLSGGYKIEKASSQSKIVPSHEDVRVISECSSNSDNSCHSSSTGIPPIPQTSQPYTKPKQQYGGGGLASLDSAQTNASLRVLQQQLQLRVSRLNQQQPQTPQAQPQPQQYLQSAFSVSSQSTAGTGTMAPPPDVNLFTPTSAMSTSSSLEGRNGVPLLPLGQHVLHSSSGNQHSLPSSPVNSTEREGHEAAITPRMSSDSQLKPKSVMFSIGSQLTSTLLPNQIMHAIIDTLSDADHGQFECTADSVSPFLVHCSDPKNNVLFDVEVVHATVDHINCIRMHKVSGGSWKYIATIRYITRLLQYTLDM